MKCFNCGRDVSKGPMHVQARCQRWYEKQRDFCQWSCFNDYGKRTEQDINDITITFLGKYGEGIGILGRK